MSLETQIELLIAAINAHAAVIAENTATMRGIAAPAGNVVPITPKAEPAPAKAEKAPKKEKVAAKPEAPAAGPVEPEAPAAAEVEETPETEPAAAVEIDDSDPVKLRK